MHLVEVNDARTRKEFLEFPARLYKNEKNWIRPLDQDIDAVFDPKKNPASAVTTIRNGNSAISPDSAIWLAIAQPSSATKRLSDSAMMRQLRRA